MTGSFCFTLIHFLALELTRFPPGSSSLHDDDSAASDEDDYVREDEEDEDLGGDDFSFLASCLVFFLLSHSLSLSPLVLTDRE